MSFTSSPHTQRANVTTLINNAVSYIHSIMIYNFRQDIFQENNFNVIDESIDNLLYYA